MEGNYEVKFGANTAGKVQVSRQGLYYSFVCKCIIQEDVVCRLVARCADKCVNIGVLIPQGSGFEINKKLAVKNFTDKLVGFYLAPQHDTVVGKFVPIHPEEPFEYLSRLNSAFWEIQNGEPGVVFAHAEI